MNDRRPEPGTAWNRHCPDAWPSEWLGDSAKLPEGFHRPASSVEADLIVGRISEAEFFQRTNRPTPKANKKAMPRKPNAVVLKVKGYTTFFHGLAQHEPRLSPLAVALWCWLWTCERKGEARCTIRKLAERFSKGKTSIQRGLQELRDAGYINCIHKGRSGHSSTIYQIWCDIQTDNCPTTGTTPYPEPTTEHCLSFRKTGRRESRLLRDRVE